MLGCEVSVWVNRKGDYFDEDEDVACACVCMCVCVCVCVCACACMYACRRGEGGGPPARTATSQERQPPRGDLHSFCPRDLAQDYQEGTGMDLPYRLSVCLDRFVGLVVKASASRVADWSLMSAFAVDLFPGRVIPVT